MSRAIPRLAAWLLTLTLLCAPAFAEGPQPTELVPEAIATDSPSLCLTVGLGPGPGENERVDASSPMFAFAVSVAFPIKGRAYVDLATGFTLTGYDDHEPELYAPDDILLTTWTITASLRVGHAGEKVAVYGSAGLGLAYVRLGAIGGYGWYPEPVGSSLAPAATAALSLEAPARKRSRFLGELRSSWIDADLGAATGGSLQAGGTLVNLGWRVVF